VPLVPASAHLADDEFLDAFHSCRLSTSEFRHADHLRLAWLHLHRENFETALHHVRSGIRAFTAHHGMMHLYHETLTIAWVGLVATHDESSFHEFLLRNEPKLTTRLLHRFWTPDLLAGQEARLRWLPPDLRQLPQLIS